VTLLSAFVDRLFLRRRRLVCRDAVELMSAYLEGAMSPDEQARFEAHLARCEACIAYLDQMRATIATLGHLPTAHLPNAVVDELVDLYRRHRAS
jgi:anti-sigma factor RsiW